MMKTKSGFTVVELLTVLFISALMLITFSTVLISAVKAAARAKANFSKYQLLRIFFLTIEKDLRNTVVYDPFPFKGKEDRLEFPAYTLSRGKDGGEEKILTIGYFFQNEKLIRSQEQVSKPVLRGVKAVHFGYPYEQEAGPMTFLPFWLDEPYQGIPKAVKVSLELMNGVCFSKVISIPIGRPGVLPDREAP